MTPGLARECSGKTERQERKRCAARWWSWSHGGVRLLVVMASTDGAERPWARHALMARPGRVGLAAAPGQGRAGLEILQGETLTTALASGEAPKLPESVSAQSVLMDASSEILANLWQATAEGNPADALCLVELRGFEPLTPCMPSRDPRHGAHHEPSRSRALHQSRKTGAWWFVWVRRAELLRGCCAESLEERIGQKSCRDDIR
jgi:hypothetical protein